MALMLPVPSISVNTSALSGHSPLTPHAVTLTGDKTLIDALPYIDREYELPGARDSALAMIEEECRRYRPTKNYLEHLPLETSRFETEIMKNEFERLAARQPMEMLSMKRYGLPGPAAGLKHDISAWGECVDNSLAQLEHQGTRIENLELLERYGCNGWREHNELLGRMTQSAQRELSGLKKQVQETNWQRKSDQMAVSASLLSANQQWRELVHKNFDIEAACLALEGEIGELEEGRRVMAAEEGERLAAVGESSARGAEEGDHAVEGGAESSIPGPVEDLSGPVGTETETSCADDMEGVEEDARPSRAKVAKLDGQDQPMPSPDSG